MPLDASLASWISLSQTPGLGNEGLRRLLQVFGSPDSVLQASVSSLSKHVKPAVVQAIVAGIDESVFSTVAAWLEDPLNRVLTIADAEFPQFLLNTPDPPLLLYVKGRLDLLNAKSLAVVGSRNASTQGLRNAEAFARSISDAGLCVVSGMAHGIDAAAHLGGLQGAGSSIAVVGTGLDKVYPAANRELAHRLAQEGTIISEFSLGTPPLAANFPRRNRIISGLSQGCLVVEASLRFSYAIFLVAALGFLGVSARPPSPDWGLMVNENRGGLYALTPWALEYPAAVIALLVVGVNLMSDGVRRAVQKSG
jgi:DNA processing protein